jgi:hypothetical protein
MNAWDSRSVGNMMGTNGEGDTSQMAKDACKLVWMQPRGGQKSGTNQCPQSTLDIRRKRYSNVLKA